MKAVLRHEPLFATPRSELLLAVVFDCPASGGSRISATQVNSKMHLAFVVCFTMLHGAKSLTASYLFLTFDEPSNLSLVNEREDEPLESAYGNYARTF